MSEDKIKYGDYQVDGKSLIVIEMWILEQVESGKVADLGNYAKNPDYRRLRPGFLEKLLTNGFHNFKVNPKGIILKNVIIFKALNLENYEIEHNVTLEKCIFLDSVNFKGTIFKKSLSLNSTVFQGGIDFTGTCIAYELDATGAKFKNEQKPANFNSLRVDRHATFVDAQFHGPVDFIAARIGEQFNATGAKFESQDKPAIFNSLEVGQHAIFSNAQFQGPVDFSAAHIGKCFEANNVKFLSAEQIANFNSLRVGENANFDNAQFQGPVDFSVAHIGGQFNAGGARFENKEDGEQKANFNSMHVGESAIFQDTIFQGEVEFVAANVGGQFSAIGVQFASKYKVNLDSLKVGQHAIFCNSLFKGPVDFSFVNIAGILNTRSILDNGKNKYTIYEDSVKFTGMKIGQHAFFDNAIFIGEVDFVGAVIGGQIEASGTKFENDDKGANFNSLKVNQNVVFREALFRGPADFGSIDISGTLDTSQSIFENKDNNEQKISFNNMKIGQNVILYGTVFQREVNFMSVNIGGDLDARFAQFVFIGEKCANFESMKVGKHAVFQSSYFKGQTNLSFINIGGTLDTGPENEKKIPTYFEKLVKFDGMLIKQHCFFSNTIFLGEVSFNGVKIGGYFIFSGAQVISEKEAGFGFIEVEQQVTQPRPGALLPHEATFDSMKVGQQAYFDQTRFIGPVKFGNADIGGDFILNGAKFENQGQDIRFDGMKVGMKVSFRGVIFMGKVFLADATLLDLYIQGENDHPSISILNLERTLIQRKLQIENIKIDKLKASSLSVKGKTIFKNSSIKNSANLCDSNFQQLIFEEIIMPKTKDLVWLDGLTYFSISYKEEMEKIKKEKEQKGWQNIIDLIENSRLNNQNYSQLDAYFQRCGLKQWADKVFIAGKRRSLWAGIQEKRLYIDHYGTSFREIPLRNFVNKIIKNISNVGTMIFWDGLAGYGRKVQRIFWLSLVLVLIGMFFYDPIFLKGESGLLKFSKDHRWIGSFCLSLDRFLPGVNLGLAEIWKPEKIDWLTYVLWHFQKFWGYLMIPIVTTSIYTRFK